MFGCDSMCQNVSVCVIFVVLLVASVLASMRWVLCGFDRSKETKFVITKKIPRWIFLPLRFLIDSKIMSRIKLLTLRI